MYSACSLAKSELEVKIMVALPVQEWTFKTEATCHVTPSIRSLFHEQKGTNASETGQADRLYMNYSIIFTVISFYPETSILLQIIRIIHMTFRIMPEFDR